MATGDWKGTWSSFDISGLGTDAPQNDPLSFTISGSNMIFPSSGEVLWAGCTFDGSGTKAPMTPPGKSFTGSVTHNKPVFGKKTLTITSGTNSGTWTADDGNGGIPDPDPGPDHDCGHGHEERSNRH